MEVPKNYRGMKKIKEYPNHVLYIDEYGRRECFQYWDLGFTTKQIRDKKINAGMHS